MDVETGCELLIHVPACWQAEPVELAPHPARYQFLSHNSIQPISIQFPTPHRLLELSSIRQLKVIGNAVLEVIEHDEIETVIHSKVRRFHQYRVEPDKLFQSNATTIMVTSYEHGGTAVMAVTWDYGEDIGAIMTRLATARRIGRFRPELARALYERPRRSSLLPPPQIIVSNIIPVTYEGMAINEGHTVLAAYQDQASSTPITMAVMRNTIDIVFDHRVYNPPDEAAFVKQFISELDELLLQEDANAS